jgi:outer membrane lipopolysaccharide assembly protein LptE/RlpB
MSLMKKIWILCLMLLLIQNCGYKPIYSKNQKINFYIESINFSDPNNNIADYIKSNLKNYINKKDGDKYIINTNIQYNKRTLSKNITGEIEKYDLSLNVSFEIKSKTFNKKLDFQENFIMNNLGDELEERRYEENIKRNMALSITSQLLILLSRNDN